MTTQAPVVEIADLMHSIEGAVVDGGETTEQGFHLLLRDGRVLLFTGDFVVAIFRPEYSRSVH